MPQKPLLKAGKKIEKKKEAANRHGKVPLTKKGKYEKPPKNAKELQAFNDAKELTRVINKRNESSAAGMAANAGGKLKVISAPPVLAPKDKQPKKGGQPAQQGGPTQMEEDE